MTSREPHRDTPAPRPRAADRAGPVPVAAGPQDAARLLEGTHHDPHAVLGAHPVPGGVAVRVLRPYARAVTVVAGGVRVALDGLTAEVTPESAARLELRPGVTVVASWKATASRTVPRA